MKAMEHVSYQILTNLNCNLDCSYCYEHKGRGPNNPEDMKKFLAFLLKEDTRSGKVGKDTQVSVDYIGGESLLYPEIMDEVSSFFFEEIKQYKLNRPPIFSTSSNGTLLNKPEVREFLTKWRNFFSIGLSIDGLQETHDKYRIYKDTRKGSYQDIIDNLPWLFNTLRPCRIGIKATYTHETLPRYAEGVINLIKMGFKDIAANFIFEEKMDERDGVKIAYQLMEIADYLVDNDLEKEVHMLQLRSGEKNIDWMMDYGEHWGHMNDEANYCGSCVYMRCLGYDRKIYGCNRFVTMNKPNMEIGYLTDMGIDISQHEFVEEVKKQYLLWPEECKECVLKRECAHCAAIPYESNSSIEDFINEKRSCGFTKAQALARLYYKNRLVQKYKKA